MDIDKEIELKEAISSLAQRYDIGGHILLYIDEGKIKVIGEMTMSALAPILMKVVSDKLKGG